MEPVDPIANEEIMIAGETPPEILEQCMGRYRFATQFAGGRRVLDIGCAGGHGSNLLAESGADEVIAVDISQDAVLHAAKNDDSSDVLYVCADITRSPFRGSFDMIVAFEVIEHCEQPAAFLETVVEMLDDDGMLLISTPNGQRQAFTLYRHPHHSFEWLPSQFEAHLREHFEDVALYGQGQIGPPTARAVRARSASISSATLAHRGVRRLLRKISDALGYREQRGAELRELATYIRDIPMGQLAVCRSKK
jgi:SAM-dependent methyltransferase